MGHAGTDQTGRTVGLLLLLGLVLLAIAFAILAADRNVRSAAQPPTAVDASPEAAGAAAFLGAGFGGISQSALETTRFRGNSQRRR